MQPDHYPLMTKPAPGWAWRTGSEPGLYWLQRDGAAVGSISLMPNQVTHESLFMDGLIEILNNPPIST